MSVGALKKILMYTNTYVKEGKEVVFNAFTKKNKKEGRKKKEVSKDKEEQKVDILI